MTTEPGGGASESAKGEAATGRSTRKGPSAFRTIGEASEELGVPQHVLRFWETKFTQLKPLKRAGGRRYYRPEDMELLGRIRDLLYQDGFTIKGAKRSLSQKGGAKPGDAPELDEADDDEEIEEAAAETEFQAGESDEEEEAPEEEAAPEPAPAPLFDSLEPSPPPAQSGEAERLRAALQELHSDLTDLRRRIAERLAGTGD